MTWEFWFDCLWAGAEGYAGVCSCVPQNNDALAVAEGYTCPGA